MKHAINRLSQSLAKITKLINKTELAPDHNGVSDKKLESWKDMAIDFIKAIEVLNRDMDK